MKILFIAGLALLALSCSGNRKTRTDPGRPAAVGDAKSEKSILSGDSDESDLVLLGPGGSSLRFLDAKALTAYYKNVFPMQDFGYRHCALAKPRRAEDCRDSIFNSAERPDLGTVDLFSPRVRRGISNMNPTENLSLNYMRTLRAGLSRECGSLVDREFKALKAGNVTANSLITSELVTAEAIDSFMARLLGLSGSGIAVDVSASDYELAFKESVGDKTGGERDTAVRESYLSLCIAISMDPQVTAY